MKLHSLYTKQLLFLVLIFTGTSLYAHKNDSTSRNETTDIMYQEKGSIVFSEEQLLKPPKARKPLKAYKLTNKSNLFLTVSLKKPLAESLRDLAPSLAVDSLVKIGNYQFSFFVDGRLIYKTELLPGAPSPQQQQTETLWSRPLIDNQRESGLWTLSAWNRFLYNGGDSALTDGYHLLKIEIRPYIKTAVLSEGDVIAAGQLSMRVERKVIPDPSGVILSGLKPYDGFPVSTDVFDKNKIKMLKANIDAAVFKRITSVVIIKNGKIMVEEYFNGASRESLHDVRSVGKSLASSLMGMAINDGHLRSENQLLKDFYDIQTYAHYSAAKASVSLKELLTMSSRFDGDDEDPHSPGNEENMYPTDDWKKFTLDLPLDTLKYQGQWHYFTAGVMLLGCILDQALPNGLERYAAEHLFRPLQITDYQWQYTPQRRVSMAGGIRMKALDLAKFGQLYKNKGKWKGLQLIPETWVEKTFTKHLPITGRKNEYYGYLFWNKTFPGRHKPYETYYCTGNGGNKIFIFKDEPLVVVITAQAYGQAYAHPQVDKIMEEFIIPAVTE